MGEDITILYVEDEVIIRDEVVEILELDFDNILVASNGEEGLELFKQYHPDIIISDVQMPKMDGVTMSIKIKEINPDVPIVLTTAFNESHYIEQAAQINIQYFLSKPIEVSELLGIIKRCLHDTGKSK